MRSVIRKPNIKKSISSRTTGRVIRTAHQALDPTYGKKGVGYIKDPKRAVYNKTYNSTSYGVKDIVRPPKSISSKSSSISSYRTSSHSDKYIVTNNNISDFVRECPYVVDTLRSSYKRKAFWGVLLILIAILVFVFLIPPLSLMFGSVAVCASIHLLEKANQYRNAYKDAKSQLDEIHF